MIIIRTKANLFLKKFPCIYKAIQNSIRFCYVIAEFFFIPIIISIFRIYSCTIETSEVEVFLDYFCEFACWTPRHVIILIISSILLIAFSYLFLNSLQEIEQAKKAKKLHFSQNIFFKQSFTLFKIMLSGISVLLAFKPLLMIFFLLGCQSLIFVVSLCMKPYGEIKRLNIMISGQFFLLVVTCIGSIVGLMTDDLDLNYVIFPIWSTGFILILILLLNAPDLISSMEGKTETNAKKLMQSIANIKGKFAQKKNSSNKILNS